MNIPEHILHSHDCDIGYTRIKKGRGFCYIDEKQKKITDKSILRRLANLVIPPAWTKVWICKNENGSLQASGYDSRGRKQYIYHTDWAIYRNLDKFENIYRFGEDLGKICLQIWQDISAKGWPKEKVVALAIAILDETYVRVGNKFYSETNNTYGLTTLRRKHLKENSGYLVFSYIAKGSKKLNINIENKKLCRLIKACAELPGHEVFQYLDEENNPHPICSQDINNYLKDVTGENYTAKDFRTWGGSVTALEQLEDSLEIVKNNPRLKLANVVVKGVSKVLCNTIAICRKYYIHPAVFSAIEQGIVDKFLPDKTIIDKYKELDIFEIQLMLILENYYSTNNLKNHTK
ncbi:MAG: topoisomerase [Burkholderiales bacterium]|jgi:DNA topoisomerase-1|nr:topoisomerase [Burkholderiales bacterium]